jgi:inner membrane protein
MFPWWAWAVIGGMLALAEIHAPGSYLIWIALGAGVTAAVDAAAGGLSTEAQIITMVIAAGLSCMAGYVVYRRADPGQRNETTLNQRETMLLGAHGVVSAEIVHGQGKVRLGDTVWLAEGPDMPAGTPIIVRSVTRARVHVAPLAVETRSRD